MKYKRVCFFTFEINKIQPQENDPDVIWYDVRRVRQKGTVTNWSGWSRWHQPFKVSGDYSAIR